MTAPAGGPSSFPQDPGAPAAAGDRSREEEEEPQGPVIRDKRRLDPQTGELRQQPTAGSAAAAARPDVPAGSSVAEAPPGDGDGTTVEEGASGETASPDATALQQQLDERTEDLRRVTAEYANYRKRVERDRTAVVEAATGGVLAALLPVLDDLSRAREHGDLTGAFARVGEALEKAVASLGLQRFGEAGEPFDPTVHEALTHGLSPDVTETTAVQVFQPGYRLGDRVLRPARVAVADPGEPDQQDQQE